MQDSHHPTQHPDLTSADLISDEGFVAYHSATADEQTMLYWRKWIVDHPHHQDTVQEAFALLDSMLVHLDQEEYQDQKMQFLDAIASDPIPMRPSQRYRWAVWVSAASILCIISLLGIYRYRPTMTDKRTPIEWISKTAPQGKISKISFSDGSTVMLMGGSTLSYAAASGKKDSLLVRLSGTAQFDIAKKPNRNFVVQTELTEVAVLGTKFLIEEREHSQQEISLFEGKISLKASNSTQKEVLNPGQRAFIDIHGHIHLHSLDKREVDDMERGIIRFNDASFEEVAHTLKRHYNVQILSQDTDKAWRFNGQFERMKVEDILAAICFAKGLEFKKTNDDTYTVY